MTTTATVLAVQNAEGILFAPTAIPAVPPGTDTNATMVLALFNSTTSSTVNAYVTGLAINNNSAVCLMEADGQSVYYPANPSTNGSALAANCAIPLGAPGTTTNVTIPYIAGGRVWFCVGNTLTFLLNVGNTGPGLVEPSATNPSDPNYNLQWDFCEFTFNSAQLYANITYVDFVCLPIALTLTNTSNASYHVSGFAAGGLDTIANNLIAQNAIDGAGWDQLIVQDNGSTLRVLSPTNGIIFNSSLFQNYWTSYVADVWAKYVSSPLTVDTQAQWGTVTGYTSNDRTEITFSSVGSFTMPSAYDIFNSSTGAFAAQVTNTDELLNIGARLNAAFNRTTLLIDAVQPDDEVVSTYYQNSITNHYARIVHAENLDNKGYCFPYDDVTPPGGVDQSGFVADSAPVELLISIGGGNATARRQAPPQVKQRNAQKTAMGRPKIGRRDLTSWAEDVKVQPFQQMAIESSGRDLEKGGLEMQIEEPRSSILKKLKLPPTLERLVGPYLAKIQETPFYVNRLKPVLELLGQLLISILSLSIRTIVSRLFIVVFFFLFYFLGFIPHGQSGETQRRVLESALATGNTNGTMIVQN